MSAVRGVGAILAVMAAITIAQQAARPVLAARLGPGDFRAPTLLSETGLYVGGRVGVVAPPNRPFAPQYPLWSDGAAKHRWVFLPPGSTIDTRDASDWEFPVDTRFWKEFSFRGRRIETRLLWRASTDRWVFASYLWNTDGTDAVLAPADGVADVVEVAPGKRHSVPSVADCRACHESRRVGPLGFNALQLSTDRDPNAIHAESLAPGMVTLATLDDEGLLAPARHDLVVRPPRIHASHPLTRAVLGYFAANCGACHNDRGEIAALVPSLAHDALANGDEVVGRLVGHATRWEVPGAAEGASVLIDVNTPQASAILARMRSRRPSSQMPPLGTVVRDQEAVNAVTAWIETLRGVTTGGRPQP